MRSLKTRHYDPGEVILREGETTEHFYLITKGHVEVIVKDHHGEDVTAASLDQGQYFGEIELLRGGANRATIVANPSVEVELAVLDRAQFDELIGRHDETQAGLDEIAEARLAENRESRTRQP